MSFIKYSEAPIGKVYSKDELLQEAISDTLQCLGCGKTLNPKISESKLHGTLIVCECGYQTPVLFRKPEDENV
jgi:predicted RNA-binding Zn-ribbon protein involved in translation (DUF1610 family)